jgi:Protein of unknown function DUF99
LNLRSRPHILGVDDAPFDKHQAGPVPVIAVAMEGNDVIESVALREFPVDGDGATDYLASWITSLRARPMLQAVILGGITIAGLGIVDVTALAERLGLGRCWSRPATIRPAPSSPTRCGRPGCRWAQDGLREESSIGPFRLPYPT